MKTSSAGLTLFFWGRNRLTPTHSKQLEEILITADIGVATAVELIRILEQRLKRNELQDADALKIGPQGGDACQAVQALQPSGYWTASLLSSSWLSG